MALKFEKITRSNMRKLQPGKQIAEHGIIFKRLQNNDGQFLINLMVDGERIHRTIGRESENVTRQQVEEVIAKIKTDARAGRLSLPKGRKTVLSFKEASEKYLDKLAEQKETVSHIRLKRGHFKHHLIPFFKNTPLDKISTFDVTRYKKKREANGENKGSINVTLQTLNHCFNMGVEWGWLKHSPAKVKKFNEEPGRLIYLIQEQVERLLNQAKQSQPYLYLFIKIALDTSMRKMEILSIRLENIDIDRLRVFIPHAKKGARNQPMTKELAEILKKEIEMAEAGQVWLFPSPQSKTGHIVSIRKSYRTLIESAGLKKNEVVCHTLRHTAITHLIRAGVPLTDIPKISGHKDIKTVARYCQANGNDIDTAMDKLSASYNPPEQAKLKAV